MKKALFTLLACVAALTVQSQNVLDGSDPGLQQLPKSLGSGVGPAIYHPSAPSYPTPYPVAFHRMVSPADFQQLLTAINAQSFASQQLPMIQAAGLCGWFTCQQCAMLMQIFPFDDNRLQALRYIAPHLIDPYYCQPIMNVLTFDTSRQSAWNIITALHRY